MLESKIPPKLALRVSVPTELWIGGGGGGGLILNWAADPADAHSRRRRLLMRFAPRQNSMGRGMRQGQDAGGAGIMPSMPVVHRVVDGLRIT